MSISNACPDTAARAHVEGIRMVGPYHHYGIHEPVAVGDNDNLPVAEQPAGDDWLTPEETAEIVGDINSVRWPYLFPADRGPFIRIYGGKRFYPFSPRASEVDIRAIAHSLARLVRYTGHGGRFYSVSEHSVHIADWLLPRHGARVALAGLLHDSPEALSGFGDVARPSKQRAPIIKETEQAIWLAVAAAFCLSPVMPEAVHEADNRIITDEMRQNLDGYEHDAEPLGVTLEFWSPERAEAEFLDAYRMLVAAVEKGRRRRDLY